VGQSVERSTTGPARSSFGAWHGGRSLAKGATAAARALKQQRVSATQAPAPLHPLTGFAGDALLPALQRQSLAARREATASPRAASASGQHFLRRQPSPSQHRAAGQLAPSHVARPVRPQTDSARPWGWKLRRILQFARLGSDVEARREGSLSPNALGKLPRTKGLPRPIQHSPCRIRRRRLLEPAPCDCSTVASPRARALIFAVDIVQTHTAVDCAPIGAPRTGKALAACDGIHFHFRCPYGVGHRLMRAAHAYIPETYPRLLMLNPEPIGSLRRHPT
jgi:hypothetical protein